MWIYEWILFTYKRQNCKSEFKNSSSIILFFTNWKQEKNRQWGLWLSQKSFREAPLQEGMEWRTSAILPQDRTKSYQRIKRTVFFLYPEEKKYIFTSQSSYCFQSIKEEFQKHKKLNIVYFSEHWGSKKGEREKTLSKNCLLFHRHQQFLLIFKEGNNYCECSKLLFLWQQSLGVAPGWGAWRALLQAKLETQDATGLLD